MEDLWRLSATDVAAAVRAKKVSAREVAQAALARLDAVNPRINAVIEHRPEQVLAQAAVVDAAISRGEEPGPLAGVPVTIKANIDQEGFATTNGIKLQRDTIARSNSPVVDNLRKAGAVMLGRTNCPAFSYRWFTSNLIHGDTKNPRDPAITPGGSSGGAGAAVAAGIGHIAHGTDIAGSIRYPAYACGVHGLRPTVGRVAAFNAALPERPIGPQISAVSGPLARTIGDLRIALAAMSEFDARDPWWVPAPLREPADLQTKLWLGDGYEAQLEAAEREGDPGALACLRGNRSKVFPFDATTLSTILTRRATFTREWLEFLEKYPVLLMPVSGELPFADQLDRKDETSFARVWQAQVPQIAIPFMGLPGLTVSTGLVGRIPVGVQLVAGRYREDLCLLAGEAIEAGGTPAAPIDPIG
jgi:amidase